MYMTGEYIIHVIENMHYGNILCILMAMNLMVMQTCNIHKVHDINMCGLVTTAHVLSPSNQSKNTQSLALKHWACSNYPLPAVGCGNERRLGTAVNSWILRGYWMN